MSAAKASARAEVERLIRLALLRPQELADLTAPQLDLALRLVRRSRLLGRIAADLRQSGDIERLPNTVRDALESASVMAAARERVGRWELDRIAWAMRDQLPVRLICMKGMAYALLGLPNARGRMFADVDLLVAEEQLEFVEAVLNSFGWRTQKLSPYDDNYYRKWTHELPPLTHPEREVEVDLHHNIVPRTARIKPPAASMLENAERIEGSSYYVLSGVDMLLHTMVHLMFDSDLADKLRDLADIDAIARELMDGDADFWDRLLARADELGLGRPTYYSLNYANRLLDTPIPAAVMTRVDRWRPIAPVRWLMDRLVPRALLPQHPDFPSRTTAICRKLLYVRSHWLRMPPWLLAYHLLNKMIRTRLPATVQDERSHEAA